MANTAIRKPRCANCPHYGYHSGPVAQKVKGAFLRTGSRYCSGGKRIRVFKSSDPKVYVPSWCPRRKSPAELRVYCYKDTNAWYLRHLLERDGFHSPPFGYEYAVRYEGNTTLTARDFHEQLRSHPIADILGFEVKTGEVIEIDDGLIGNLVDGDGGILAHLAHDAVEETLIQPISGLWEADLGAGIAAALEGGGIPVNSNRTVPGFFHAAKSDKMEPRKRRIIGVHPGAVHKRSGKARHGLPAVKQNMSLSTF